MDRSKAFLPPDALPHGPCCEDLGSFAAPLLAAEVFCTTITPNDNRFYEPSAGLQIARGIGGHGFACIALLYVFTSLPLIACIFVHALDFFAFRSAMSTLLPISARRLWVHLATSTASAMASTHEYEAECAEYVCQCICNTIRAWCLFQIR